MRIVKIQLGPRKGGPTLELGGLPETASGLTSRELSCTPTGWTDNGRERASFHSMALDRPRSRGWAQRYEEAPETGGLGASSVPWGNHDGGGKPHHCGLGIRPNCRFNPPKKRKPDWLAELSPLVSLYSFPRVHPTLKLPTWQISGQVVVTTWKVGPGVRGGAPTRLHRAARPGDRLLALIVLHTVGGGRV